VQVFETLGVQQKARTVKDNRPYQGLT